MEYILSGCSFPVAGMLACILPEYCSVANLAESGMIRFAHASLVPGFEPPYFSSRSIVPSLLRQHDTPGGESGIRTHGTLAGTLVFKTSSLNRSDISPKNRVYHITNGIASRAMIYCYHARDTTKRRYSCYFRCRYFYEAGVRRINTDNRVSSIRPCGR